MTFGERLRLCMVESGYKQKELAEIIGITPTRLNYWIKDKREPDIPWIRKLAKTLNVTTDYLIGNTADPANVDTNDTAPVVYSERALRLAALYDSLSDEGRETIDKSVEIAERHFVQAAKPVKVV